ncbi:MAG: PEP-CTERM sorting domain-containing protein [Verrucomicrobia bacterium]|nr:PEP-CTERM sorting domain-containing protein [Verrucomicrobiota bacterium]
MNKKLFVVVTMVLAVATAGSLKADLSYALTSSAGVFVLPHPSPPTTLPSSSMFQVWWSLDAITMFDSPGGNVSLASAQATILGTVDAGSSDILLRQGVTTAVAGFAVASLAFTASDSDVGGADVNAGFLYSILYATQSTPIIGTALAYSEIQDTSAMTDYDPPAPAPPASAEVDKIDFVGGPVIDDGSHSQVVPEPSTVALFALGLVTIAWRRWKK